MSDVLLLMFVGGMQFSTPEASRKAAEAYYKQSGIENSVEDWIERNSNKELRARLGQLQFVTRSIIDQKVQIEWRFP